ncbi:MAG: acylphosphatase [Thermodesulfobacteriota bacterium]
MSSDIKQATIVIEGTVQFVGFRSYIEELASRRDLKGFVYNDIPEGNVKLICEGEVHNIKGLIEEIGKSPHVSRVDVKDEILLPKPVGRVVVGIERDTLTG